MITQIVFITNRKASVSTSIRKSMKSRQNAFKKCHLQSLRNNWKKVKNQDKKVILWLLVAPKLVFLNQMANRTFNFRKVSYQIILSHLRIARPINSLSYGRIYNSLKTKCRYQMIKNHILRHRRYQRKIKNRLKFKQMGKHLFFSHQSTML